MNFRWMLIALYLVFPLGVLRAEVVPARPISVDDLEAITRAKGTEIQVEGRVRQAFWVRQVLMVTFREEKEGFVAVSFARYRNALNEAFGGDITQALPGKRIRLQGVVTEYYGRPQIVIEKPEQLTVLKEE